MLQLATSEFKKKPAADYTYISTLHSGLIRMSCVSDEREVCNWQKLLNKIRKHKIQFQAKGKKYNYSILSSIFQ